MPKPSFFTITEQVTQHLKAEILSRHYTGEMPGKHVLATELEVSHKTVDVALQNLEREGLLVAQGPGRNRRILPPAEGIRPVGLRVGLLLFFPGDRSWASFVDLQHRLANAGHTLVDPKKTLQDLDFNPSRVARLVERYEADAWVVVAASAEILQWFCQKGIPTFSIFGRYEELRIAALGATGKGEIVTQIVKNFIDLGHSRITMLIRRHHHEPKLCDTIRCFRSILQKEGLGFSTFNVPLWDNNPEGLRDCLVELFRLTPPTAIIVDEYEHYLPICNFLLHRGLCVPRDVSLVCMEADPNFAWCRPIVSHVHMNLSKMARSVLQWLNNVSLNKPDFRQMSVQVEYVTGGTVGPAPTYAASQQRPS